jgi:hypothetical protein
VKINLFNQNHFNKKNVFCLLLFIGLALHLIYLFQFDDYFDDWNFFFTVDTSTATVGQQKGGGYPVSVGPVTLTA